jgi:hypothetical protein
MGKNRDNLCIFHRSVTHGSFGFVALEFEDVKTRDARSGTLSNMRIQQAEIKYNLMQSMKNLRDN